MLALISLTLTLTLTLATPVPGKPKLPKPALRPDLQLAQGIIEHTSVPQISSTVLPKGTLTADCKAVAEERKLPLSEMEVFRFSFDDCPDPWIWCRHKDAPIQKDTLIETFGRLPVGMRNFAKTVVAINGSIGGQNAGDLITLVGPLKNLLTVLVHELAHSLDSPVPGEPRFSEGATWKAAYDADSAVPDNYARSTQVENFAQAVVVALYDAVVPGGIATAIPDAQRMEHQYRAARELLPKNVFEPGGTCARVRPNSPRVCV